MLLASTRAEKCLSTRCRGGARHILGMAQRAEVRSDVTRGIVARITGEIRAWRIVLFGSRARGDATQESDWDIYLEVDAPRESLKEIHNVVGSLLSRFGVSVDTKVARAGEIERRREDPGTIEWDVAREGLLLYSDPAAPTTLAPPRRIGEPPKELPESVHEWLRRRSAICASPNWSGALMKTSLRRSAGSRIRPARRS